MNGAILQQVFVVEFVVQYQMCDDCHRVEAKDFWKAVVQVRQKVRVCFFKIKYINNKLKIKKKIISIVFILPDLYSNFHLFKNIQINEQITDTKGLQML